MLNQQGDVKVREKRRFGSIRPKGNGVEVAYRHNGKRTTFMASDVAEAEVKLAKIEKQISMGKYVEDDSIPTLAGYLNKWLDLYILPVRAAGTYRNYRDMIQNHVNPRVGRYKINRLKVDMFQQFFNDLSVGGRLDGKGGGLSVKTLRNMKTMLNEVFTQGIVKGDFEYNPISGIMLEGKPQKEMRFLTVSEQSSIESMCRVSMKVNLLGIIIDVRTGLRLGELMGLQWDCIHMEADRPYINVKQQLIRQLKKAKMYPGSIIIREGDEKTNLVLTPKLKSKNSYRRLSLSPYLMEQLQTIQAWQNEMHRMFGESFNPHSFVFCSEQGDVYDPSTYANEFRKLATAAGVAGANFHCLRHTFATRLSEKGVPIATISKLLGHAKSSTTLDMYTHSTGDDMDAAMKISVLDTDCQ